MALRYTSSFDKTLGFSDTQAQVGLTVGVAQVVTIPGTSAQKFVLTFGCSSNANIYVGYNVTPTVVGANATSAQPFVEFVVPGDQRYALGGDVLTFISSDATAKLGVSIRSITN